VGRLGRPAGGREGQQRRRQGPGAGGGVGRHERRDHRVEPRPVGARGGPERAQAGRRAGQDVVALRREPRPPPEQAAGRGVERELRHGHSRLEPAGQLGDLRGAPGGPARDRVPGGGAAGSHATARGASPLPAATPLAMMGTP
jgi:hypothetical protein